MSILSSQIEAFLMLAEVHHFTKASKRLGLSQSALSQRILNLEDDLEMTLFIRDFSGVRLTESGQDLLRYCQVIQSAESDFLAKVKGPDLGKGSSIVGAIRIAGGLPRGAWLIRTRAEKPLCEATRRICIHLLGTVVGGW